jgi:hypothetical protein
MRSYGLQLHEYNVRVMCMPVSPEQQGTVMTAVALAWQAWVMSHFEGPSNASPVCKCSMFHVRPKLDQVRPRTFRGPSEMSQIPRLFLVIHSRYVLNSMPMFTRPLPVQGVFSSMEALDFVYLYRSAGISAASRGLSIIDINENHLLQYIRMRVFVYNPSKLGVCLHY